VRARRAAELEQHARRAADVAERDEHRRVRLARVARRPRRAPASFCRRERGADARERGARERV
jgi:hypothetical protein